MSDAAYCYTGREPDCGCVVAAVVDSPDHRRDTAREIGRFVRSGLLIDRMTVEEARPLIKSCPHRPKALP